MIAAFQKAFNRRAASGNSLSLVMPLNPVPASRPRVGRWGVHYLKTYSTWMNQVALTLPKGDVHYPKETALAVMTEFVVKKPKTTKKLWPRGDNDNYEKAAWDAITKCQAIWDDDDQIILNLTVKRFTKLTEEPHTKVTVVAL